MTSTEFNVGLTGGEKSSSRVLKPPGGGHTSLFGESEVKVSKSRPKYDQQNSSNLNFCMNTVDPNVLVEQVKDPKTKPSAEPAAQPKSATGGSADSIGSQNHQAGGNDAGRPRVPPGGFSSGGFW